ncbi:MAG: glutathione S-transferase [Gammaproteobacteria bacterium]|jgi:glutathione S-transferase
MLSLYHHWDSVCSFKVRMCLIEKQLEYQSQIVDLIQFNNLQPEYLALNPNGVVPTLKDDEDIIIESTIINEYLDDKHKNPSLIPADPVLRAKMRTLVKLQDDVLYHAQRPAAFQLMVKRMLTNLSREQIDELVHAHPQPERASHFLNWATGPIDPEVVAEAKEKIEPVLARLETALVDGPWLVGNEFTLADVAYAPFVNRLQRLLFHDLWADKPKVTEWIALLIDRPSFSASVGPADQQMPCPADDA